KSGHVTLDPPGRRGYGVTSPGGIDPRSTSAAYPARRPPSGSARGIGGNHRLHPRRRVCGSHVRATVSVARPWPAVRRDDLPVLISALSHGAGRRGDGGRRDAEQRASDPPEEQGLSRSAREKLPRACPELAPPERRRP